MVKSTRSETSLFFLSLLILYVEIKSKSNKFPTILRKLQDFPFMEFIQKINVMV